MESKQLLVEELTKLTLEVSKLRDSLNELDRQKESWFGKKEEYSAKIRASIQKIKGNKSKRDLLTAEVKGIKPKRDSINKDISSEQKELERLKKEKAGLEKSLGIKEPPSRIKQQMERLEFKIETDTFSFEKEKELMKKIKELKKLYENSAVIAELSGKIRGVSEHTAKMRKESDAIHKSVQEKAGQSQVLHEEILKVSAEIDKIKIDEEAAFNKFSEYKKQFAEINNKLKEKLGEINGVKGQLDKIDNERREKRRSEQESFLKSKEDAVNEKIKRREKLTTEDLLVFQKFGR